MPRSRSTGPTGSDPYWVLSYGAKVRPSVWPKPHPGATELRAIAKREGCTVAELRAADREGVGKAPTIARLRAVKALRRARWLP